MTKDEIWLEKNATPQEYLKAAKFWSESMWRMPTAKHLRDLIEESRNE